MPVVIPPSFLSTPAHVLLVALLLFSCTKEKSLNEMKEYEGPNAIMKDVVTLYSDSGFVKVRMAAPLQIELKNGNQRFPKGMKVDFYEKDGSISSVLTANHGVFNKANGIFTATGNVVLDNLKEKEKLNTEVLHWNRILKKVYTDKFVTVRQGDDLLKGEGLDASQDFTIWKFKKPIGDLPFGDDEDEEDTLSVD